MSGKSDKEQQAKDALIVQAARNNQLSNASAKAPSNKPPPPIGANTKPKSVLQSVGFSQLNGSDDDSDSPRMKTRLSLTVR